ncbi:MAG: hypothetical protein ABI053_04700 [Lacisediminihabitans sp.]
MAKRPPLTPRAKSGARWAGIIGFNLISLGWGMFVVPVVLSIFAAFFVFLIGRLEPSSAATNRGLYQLKNFIESINVSAWILPLTLVAVLGIVVWWLGIFVSGRILRSHAVNRPRGVTWAAAGVAIVGSWFLSWIGSVFVQIVTAVTNTTDTPMWVGIVIGGAVGFVAAIVVNSVIGWLAWWWMAHAMRSARPVA